MKKKSSIKNRKPALHSSLSDEGSPRRLAASQVVPCPQRATGKIANKANSDTPTLRNSAPTLPVSARKIKRLRNASSLTSSSLEQTNPLRGLTLARAVSLMESTLRGEYAIPQWTLWHVEQSDPDLVALESRRSSAIMEMDWCIKIADLSSRLNVGAELARARPKIDAALAAQQAEALLEAYNRFDNLNECIEDMAIAFCRGFSISQLESASDASIQNPKSQIENSITHLGVYDPWNIIRHGLKGDFYFNPGAQAVSWQSLGEQNRIDPANHIIYTPRVSLMRIALYKFIRQNLSQKDWDAFIEIYGLPSCFIILPPNIPEGKEAEYETAAKDAAEGGSGALPNGSEAKFATEARGVNPFRDHLKYLQEQLILAGTGGLLTMLAEPTGIGQGATSAHEDTFKIIARGEAKKISEVFQKQFDKRILEAAFPGKPILAYFEISSKEEQDVGEIIDHAVKLSQAGFTMDPAQLSEKTGYKIEVSGQSLNGQSDFRPLTSDKPTSDLSLAKSAPASPPGQSTGGARSEASERDAVLRNRARMGNAASPEQNRRAPIPAGSLLNQSIRDQRSEVSNPKSEIENRKLVSAAVAETLGVRSEWLEPFFAHLEEIAQNGLLSDSDLLDAIEAMAKSLPELLTADKVQATAAIVQEVLSKSVGVSAVAPGVKS